MGRRDVPDEVNSIQEAVQSTAKKQLELDDFCRLLDHSRAHTINFKEWAEKKGYSQMTHTRDLWYKLYDTFADETDIKHTYSSIDDYASVMFGDSDDEAYFKSFIRDKHPEINDTFAPVRISDLNKAYNEFMESKKPKPLDLEELLNKHVPLTLHEEFLLYLIKNRTTEFKSEDSFLYHYKQWKELRLPKYEDVLVCKEHWEDRIASNQMVEEDPVLSFCIKHGLAYFDLTASGKFVRFNYDLINQWYKPDGLYTLTEYCMNYLTDNEKTKLFQSWVPNSKKTAKLSHNEWFALYSEFSPGYENWVLDRQNNAEAVSEVIEESVLDHNQEKHRRLEELHGYINNCGFWEQKAFKSLLDYIEWEHMKEE